MSALSHNTLKPQSCSGSGSDRDDVCSLKAVPYVKVVHVDPALDAASWALLKSRFDKEWSLVDAASFIVMQERGIIEALTTDHHFEQAGFVRLLK